MNDGFVQLGYSALVGLAVKFDFLFYFIPL